MTEDAQLLRRFAEEGAQDAFAELVRRQVNLVYSAALRQVGGDAHLAADVTQGVFLALARSARSLAGRPVLTGWLYTTTRYTAAKIVRTRCRRQASEAEAHAMNEILHQGTPEPDWDRLRPVLDEAMHELSERDREAILLRYFENRPFAEIGAACGLPENSARMRVERALDKLRVRLAKRGITSTAAALGAALSAQPVVTAPAGLAATVASASVVGAAAGGGAPGAWSFMSMTKLKVGAVCAVVGLLGVGAYVANGIRVEVERELAAATDTSARQTREIATLREENRRLSNEIVRLNAIRTVPVPPPAARMVAAPQPDRAAQVRRAVMNNFMMISAARDQFYFKNGRTPANLDELVGKEKYIRQLNVADGEDYGRLDFTGRKLSVTTPSGVTFSFPDLSYSPPVRLGMLPGKQMLGRPMPAASLQAAILTAIQAFRLAHELEYPPSDDPHRLLSCFEDPKVAADFLEWWEAHKPASP